MRCTQQLASFATILGVLTTVAPSVAAQVQPNSPMATRTALETALAEREVWANSPAYSPTLRSRARRELAQIRTRLARGDFKTGDRFVLRVEGALPFADSLTVASGPRVVIPGIRTIELAGVLRSELASRLQQEIRVTVLDATVTVQPLARVAVFGAVTNPGYQFVSFDARVDELLMGAGGPSGDSRPNRFSIMRGDTVLASASAVTDAISSGRTIGDLEMTDGDFLVVKPAPAPFDRSTIISIFAAPLLTALLLR